MCRSLETPNVSVSASLCDAIAMSWIEAHLSDQAHALLKGGASFAETAGRDHAESRKKRKGESKSGSCFVGPDNASVHTGRSRITRCALRAVASRHFTPRSHGLA